MNLTIKELHKLSKPMMVLDSSIKRSAFLDFENLTESEKQEMTEMYRISPWLYLLAKIDDRYVGRVVLDKRNIILVSNEFQCVGIGGLAVDPSFQGKGIGRSLMNHVINLCTKKNIDFLFLNARKELHKFYRSLGFVLQEYKFSGFSGKEYLEDDGMVLVLNNKAKKALEKEVFHIGLGNV